MDQHQLKYLWLFLALFQIISWDVLFILIDLRFDQKGGKLSEIIVK